MPSAEVNSVMISPHPPRLRMKRRKTVSVTPAMGARTVAGEMLTDPICSVAGTNREARTCVARAPPPATASVFSAATELSQNFLIRVGSLLDLRQSHLVVKQKPPRVRGLDSLVKTIPIRG